MHIILNSFTHYGKLSPVESLPFFARIYFPHFPSFPAFSLSCQPRPHMRQYIVSKFCCSIVCCLIFAFVLHIFLFCTKVVTHFEAVYLFVCLFVFVVATSQHAHNSFLSTSPLYAIVYCFKILLFIVCCLLFAFVSRIFLFCSFWTKVVTHFEAVCLFVCLFLSWHQTSQHAHNSIVSSCQPRPHTRQHIVSKFCC